MTTHLYYYTGTGNSLWVARCLADQIGETGVFPMTSRPPDTDQILADRIGLIFPVYMWGVPAPVLRFCQAFQPQPDSYLFAVAVNAGQVANTLVQLRRVLARRHLKLASGFTIKTPSNYIPWGGPGPAEKQQQLFAEARNKMDQITTCVRSQTVTPVEKGPLWHRLLFSGIIYKLAFNQVPKMDSRFAFDEKCNHCGICARVCPAGNITMVADQPVWNHRCEQCFACLQWCPREAIQCGPKTAGYERYHHPEIRLQDILRARE